MLDKLMKKKEGKPALSSDKIEAKRKIIEELRSVASDMMSDDLGEGMKKVSVASQTKEGLTKGLDVAKDAIAKPDLADFGDEEKNQEGLGDEDQLMDSDLPESAEQQVSEVAAGHKYGNPNHREAIGEKRSTGELSSEDARSLTKKLRSALRE